MKELPLQQKGTSSFGSHCYKKMQLGDKKKKLNKPEQIKSFQCDELLVTKFSYNLTDIQRKQEHKQKYLEIYTTTS